MKRIAIKTLTQWHDSERRKPLIIRGARQVGKSTLVRKFAEEKKLTLQEINLEKHFNLEKVFKTLDIKLILQELEATLGRRINLNDSLLFLDEIQETPSAIPALRYFFEEYPNLAIIAAGSLLEFTLKDHNFSMPVGRIQYLNLEPMTYSEFLLGIGEDYLYDQLINWDPNNKIPETAHENFIKNLNLYFVCGGMPEAVLAYKNTLSLEEARAVQSEILMTYFDDFSKYKTRINTTIIRQVFEAIPNAVGKKIKYSSFISDLRAEQIKKCIELLYQARIINKVVHSASTGFPLRAEEKKPVYKLLYLDTGLLLRALGLNLSKINTLTQEELINKGIIAEHFIGQHLIAKSTLNSDRFLNYWLREGKANNAEVDYVISLTDKILPIEVKSGKSGKLRSLNQFTLKNKSELAIRFDLNQPNRQTISTKECTYELCSLPLYLVEVFDRCFE